MNQTPLDTPICLPHTQTQGARLLPSQTTHVSISLIRTSVPTVPPKTRANRIDSSHCWDVRVARGLVIVAGLLGKHPLGEEKPGTPARGPGCSS